MDISSFKVEAIYTSLGLLLTYLIKYKEVNLAIFGFFIKRYKKYKEKKFKTTIADLKNHAIFDELDICLKYKICVLSIFIPAASNNISTFCITLHF